LFLSRQRACYVGAKIGQLPMLSGRLAAFYNCSAASTVGISWPASIIATRAVGGGLSQIVG
jgi:hypothetical protein